MHDYTSSGAIIAGDHRFLLTREWEGEAGAVTWLMLNPSTADANEDDPTIRKCVGFTRRLGFTRINVVNLYSFRSSSPKELKARGYPNDRARNDSAIRLAAHQCQVLICAWGNNAPARRAAEVLRAIRASGRSPQALRLTKSGQPGHPLYIPYSARPGPLNPRGAQ